MKKSFQKVSSFKATGGFFAPWEGPSFTFRSKCHREFDAAVLLAKLPGESRDKEA